MTDDIVVAGPSGERFDEVLTPEAVEFVVRLDNEFAQRRADLLAARRERRARLLSGEELSFDPATRSVRDDPTWHVAPAAPGLVDRRVEITGPTDRKMTINAMNSGASVWLADFEDANSPTWQNMIDGQLSLIDTVDRRISHTSPDGKRYRLRDDVEPPTIVVRPRGWHLSEKHVRVNGHPISASLMDFGLYLFHCARRQLAAGSGPYYYLPKLECAAEAALWNDVFCFAQAALGIPRGTIRATVLIETITAAFEMEEILYALREHSAGLNAGRWDYIFSVIKNFGSRPDCVLPDRSAVTMTVPFMRSYTQLLVRTCHRRGAHAIGGMAAFIPSRRDPEVNERALTQVRQDKEREAGDGFDGSWVAHPDLVPVCREVFDRVLGDRPNQRDKQRDDVRVTAADLVSFGQTPGRVTEQGVRANAGVALRYLESWLRGVGAVGIYNLMEDAATAEISRSQLWQWIHHGVRTAEGTTVTRQFVERAIAEEMGRIADEAGPNGLAGRRFDDARDILARVALGTDYPLFLTTEAYSRYLATPTETAHPAKV